MAQKSLTFKQYRAADLTIFAVILCALEAIIGVAANKWFPEQLFTVTLVYALVCLVFMRWGAFGIIHAVLAGITYAIANGGNYQNYVIHGVGNAFVALTMLYVHFVGKEKIRKSILLTVVHVLLTYLCIVVGRTLISLIFTRAIWSVFVGFLGTDALSAAIGLVIVLICRKQNGLYEDQKLFLKRTQEQRMKELRKSTVEEEDIYKKYPFLKKDSNAPTQTQASNGNGALTEATDNVMDETDLTPEQLAEIQAFSAEFAPDEQEQSTGINADNGDETL